MDVTGIVDGRTITVTDGRRVVLDAIAQPGACWSQSAVDFLTATVSGKQVRLVGEAVLLPDGTDAVVLAVEQGVARALQPMSAALSAAQTAAKTAGKGLWGAPCSGSDTIAPPPPPTQQQTVAPPPRQTVEPQPAPQPVAPPPPPSAYYANCAAARAAGAAPLYRGQPGYRAALDRDNDGVACET
ncbi:excalibur calcium-binding domain-containing protein [Actinosynnema sp. NPDC047251]|uniref:excalibur calcium-binding domain-containing protein n=1 Tax=Saccharothrix espanaensis TaxID=103731 RepID=UPI001E4EDB3B|nr:excalibur calcium-binding domain-containing protein [Saccharothrix espanaensis]